MNGNEDENAFGTDNVTKPFMIKNNTCVTCDGKVASQATITCKSCNVKFHAVCQVSTKTTKICNDTLLKSFSQASTRPNFVWYCDTCYTINEHNTKCSLHDKLNAMLLKFDALNAAFHNMQKEVANNTKSITTMVSQQKPKPNSAGGNVSSLVATANQQGKGAWDEPLVPNNVIPNPQSQGHNVKHRQYKRAEKREETTLLLKCDEQGAKPDAAQIKQVAVAYGIPVDRVNFTANNNAVISLPTKEARDKLMPLLVAKPSLKKHSVSNLKAKQPAITIRDIVDIDDEHDFMSTLKVQNASIATLIEQGESFTNVEVSTKTYGQKTTTQVHATVTPKIRDAIKKKGDRVYIGLASCRVVDRLNVSRCYRCNGHGHIANNCNEDPCCGYCASTEHETKDCSMKNNLYENRSNLSCVNCNRAGEDGYGHSVFWPLCPYNKKSRARAKRSIPYYNQDNLNG